jgi:hypothetical protein
MNRREVRQGKVKMIDQKNRTICGFSMMAGRPADAQDRVVAICNSMPGGVPARFRSAEMGRVSNFRRDSARDTSYVRADLTVSPGDNGDRFLQSASDHKTFIARLDNLDRPAAVEFDAVAPQGRL